MGRIRIIFKKSSKRHNLETKIGEQSFLRVTHCLYLIHILIKLYEDIMNSKALYLWESWSDAQWGSLTLKKDIT